MENLSIRYVFDRKHIATESKTGLLQIAVRLNKTVRKVLISTGIHLYKNQFSDKNGFTCKNHPNAAQITGKAKKIFNKIEAFCLSDECKNFESIKNWDKEYNTSYFVIDFIKSELRKKNICYGSMMYHKTLINQLDSFGKIKTFSDLTYKNISDFDFFLRKTIKESSTLNKRHTTFRYYIKQAIKMDLLKKDPYDMFDMPFRKGKDPIYLTENEISDILNYNSEIEKIQRVKDLFVFQIFTGMAYVDMTNFSKNDIIEVDGMKAIRSNREKTDQSFITLFLPEAEKIAEKYNYDLPKLSNQKYNDYLKVLGAGAEIKKNLTTHVARHTFATYLLNKDIPIETVSRAMGHSSIKMTQHYAKLLGRKVVADMKILLK